MPGKVSGFHLAHLLPENGSTSLVGSEGTCAIMVAATVELVDVPRPRCG
jgi:hypothetical protein